jgi:hypothetical protein
MPRKETNMAMRAGPLTPAQLTTLKAHITASNDLNVLPNNSDGNTEIARLLNLPASPAFWVWKSSVNESEYTRQTSDVPTTFSWPAYIARSQGERDAWARLFVGDGGADPSLASVRQAFADIFSGTGIAATQRTHLTAISRRTATRAEKLFATGTGSTAVPATMTFEGVITMSDVDSARQPVG